jgi:hypothetical protein
MSGRATDSYGRVPPGFRCGRCNRALSTSWDGACKRCGARYIDFTPTGSAPDPTADSPGMRRFKAAMFGLVAGGGLGAMILILGGGLPVAGAAALFGLAIGLMLNSRW